MAQLSTETSPDTAVAHERGVTVRSVAIAALLVIVTNMWVLRSELLTGSYATGGTPPAVAIGWLMVLLGGFFVFLSYRHSGG